ncbi:hypothetical protein [Kitasatospora sp. NPDC047058]|uniref:hypothetical protein n=1 Tax=Kitasatospora sp. NPDC047058 TaxID=3155620 RepID=UPI00340C5B4D
MKLITNLHAEARKDSGEEPPWSLGELARLHADARRCERCRDWDSRECGRCGHRSVTCDAGRAAAGPRAVRRRWNRNMAAAPGRAGHTTPGRPAGSVVGRGQVLPVPLPPGDRQNTDGLLPLAAGLEEAIQHLLEGRDRDAHLVLTEAGDKLPIHRIPDVVTACQGRGFAVAADALLHSAARRPYGDVLRIVRLFNAAQRYDEADLVLKAATSE